MNSSSPTSMTPAGTALFLLNCELELCSPLTWRRKVRVSFNPFLLEFKTRDRRWDFPTWKGRKVLNIFKNLASALQNGYSSINKYSTVSLLSVNIKLYFCIHINRIKNQTHATRGKARQSNQSRTFTFTSENKTREDRQGRHSTEFRIDHCRKYSCIEIIIDVTRKSKRCFENKWKLLEIIGFLILIIHNWNWSETSIKND